MSHSTHHDHPHPPARNRWRSARWFIALYIILLAASHVYQRTHPAPFTGNPDWLISLPATDDTNSPPAAPATQHLYVRRWEAKPIAGQSQQPTAARTPVILLHGAPGDGAGFNQLAEKLAANGHVVLAPDLPGFGLSGPAPRSASVLANAHLLAELLDHEHIPRAHVVGWSNGGGTAIHLAQLYPDKVASLTLMAAIGPQEFEGSGNHAIEHAKYATGFVLIGYLPELLPHFGALDTYAARTGWLRNFAESDQRLLVPAMHDISANADTTPTLILHGQHDILVPVASAYATHANLSPSRLVILDANHFLPFMQAEQTAALLNDFFARHDQATIPEPHAEEVLAPPPTRADQLRTRLHNWGWPAHAAIIAACTVICPPLGAIIAALGVANQIADLFIVACALTLGLFATAAWRLLTKRTVSSPTGASSNVPHLSGFSAHIATVACMQGWRIGLPGGGAWHSLTGTRLTSLRARVLSFSAFICSTLIRAAITLPLCTILVILCQYSVAPRIGTVAAIALTILLCPLVCALPALLSIRGWQRLRISVSRAIHHEFWPAWLFYAPLIPYVLWLGARTRGVLTGSACNAAIDHAGGWVGESKAAIMRALGRSESVLPTVFIDAGPPPEQRALAAIAAMREEGITLPVILKPDAGQRGFGLRLAKSDADIRAYFAAMTTPVIAQKYHPGPCECGIFWVRHTQATRREHNADPAVAGFIFSITRKDFPVVTGDGARTLEQLILQHPRYRLQHAVFLTRWRSELGRVLAPGESLRLSVSGNHCQGTLFRDGADLITPDLSRVIDALCARFGSATGVPNGLDVCRLDVRYESDALLRDGKAFGIVELNGTSAESTNLYDPSRGPLWAYGVLFAQWRHIFTLGNERALAGARVITMREFIAMMRSHYTTRVGSELAD